MTENWDFYFTSVEDQRASMYLDLGIYDDTPNAALPNMAYLRVYMNAPREDGLSSQDEFDALAAIEDAFPGKLLIEGNDYVGRCTTNGCRDFVFYTAKPEAWEGSAASLMSDFPAYRYETGTREDADWEVYLNYLYPSPAAYQGIENRRVLMALEGHGDTLTEAREIDHWASFPEPENRDAFIAEATTLGFAVRELYPPDEDSDEYAAQVWRSDIPSYNNIDDVTVPLFHLAEKHGGSYDGWECQAL